MAPDRNIACSPELIEGIGRLDREAPESHLGDNPSVFARLRGVRGQCFVGIEMFIALDG